MNPPLYVIHDPAQIFMARGNSKKKWDGSTLHNWGIAAPSTKPTLTAATIKSTQFWDFDSSEAVTGTVTIHEGSGTAGNATGHDGSANAATELTPDPKTGRATISKIFSAETDCHTIQNAAGGDTDLIHFYVYIEEPKKVDKITLMFGLTASATDPFKTDYYYFDFNLKDAEEVKIKDATAYGASSYDRLSSTVLSVATPEDVTKVKTPAEAKKILSGLEYRAGSPTTCSTMIRVAARIDKAAINPEIWDSWLINWKGEFRDSVMVASPQV